MTEPKQKCTCSRCKKTMSEIKFYKHPDGTRDEMCKDCLCAHVDSFDPTTFLWIIERFDVPYIPSEWNKLRDKTFQEDPKKCRGPVVVGKYLTKMKLNQWINKETGKRYTWADSEMLQKREAPVELTEEEKEMIKERDAALKQQFDEGLISEAEYKTLTSSETQNEQQMQQMLDFNFPGATEIPSAENGFIEENFIPESDLPDFGSELTDQDKINLALKWGRLYKPSEWIELERKYNEMINSFDIQDADSRNTLIFMCKTDLKMNQALDLGDIDGYQKLARVNSDLRKSAKFTAAQNKDKDNGQIDCTGVLIMECEAQGGFIPRYKTDYDLDIIDKIIKDSNSYVKNLITHDLGFGQEIENYLKKIQLEQEAMEKNNEEALDDEIDDEDIAAYYERIAEEREEDSKITQESNAYEKKGGEPNGTE